MGEIMINLYNENPYNNTCEYARATCINMDKSKNRVRQRKLVVKIHAQFDHTIFYKNI